MNESPRNHGAQTGGNKTSFPCLNMLRWLMATLVVIGHVRGLVFRDAAELASLPATWKIFYLLTGFGHQAVVVFFVLSGFLVGGKLSLARNLNRAELSHYMLDRFSRIYIVLVPALALTALLDGIGVSNFPIYSVNSWTSALPVPIATVLTPANFFFSLFNVTMYWGAPLGSDGPLWSLAFEWVIYLIFPFLLIDYRRIRAGRWHWTVALHLAVGIVLVVRSPALGQWLAIWLFGVCARCWLEYRARKSALTFISDALAIAAVAAAMLAGRLFLLPDVLADFLLGMLAALLCMRPAIVYWRWGAAFHDFVAGFSFSLYVVHFPVAVFVLAVGQSFDLVTTRLAPGVEAMAFFLMIVTTAFACAWTFSIVTEARTHRLRRILNNFLSAHTALLGAR